MRKQSFTAFIALWWMQIFNPSNAQAQEVPAGTILELRLRDTVSSYTAKRGDVLRAVVVASVEQDGREILPAGTEVYGNVVRVKRVGLGVIRERARLRMRFDSLAVRGVGRVALESQLVDVENAREQIQADGEIVGIRATDSYGHQMTGMVTSVAAMDPLLLLFAFASASSVLGFPEAEITYPAGTDLQIKLLQSLLVSGAMPAVMPRVAATTDEYESLRVYVNELPFRTRTNTRNIPSDLTNLMFLGSRKQVLRAFAEAGWTQAAELDPATKYKTVQALAESRGYADAPVSRLLLDGKLPSVVFEKALNTINRRHHLRVWQIAESWNGQTVWTAAATHDIGLGFSSHKKVIHRIDPEIDKERTKIANDLVFANCVESMESVARPQAPRSTYNSTGDRVITDGSLQVLRLKDCASPEDMGTTARYAGPKTSNFLYRGVRQFDLTMRNVLLRDNVGWQAYRGGRTAWKIAHRHSTTETTARGLLPEENNSDSVSEPHLAILGSSSPNARREASRPRLPEVAFSLEGGQFFRSHLGDLYLASVNPDTGDMDVFQYPMRIEPGVILGASVTLQPSKFFSHELSFGTMQANLLTGEDPTAQVDRLGIRTASYQLEANLAPRNWRIRPFVTVGGSLTSYKFRNIKLAKKNGVFKYGVHRVGTVVSAFNRAGAAPLDGGTVYQPGLTYGGGLKFRLSRLVEFQAQYRETYAKDPNFFNKQSLNYGSQGITSSQDPGARSHANYILSLSFTP